MEEDVYNALQTRTAFMPGGFDRDNKLIIIVNTINDMQLWNRTCLELTINYIKKAIGPNILSSGVSVIVDAQKSSSSRITRNHARIIYALFADIPVCLYLVREEGFWEKHVDTCTKSTTTISSLITATAKNEPIILSRARLGKYFDMRQLPEELGGTLVFNYDLWLHQRKAIDEFQKTYAQTLSAMENLQVLLLANKKLRISQIDAELKRCAQMHASVQRSIEIAIEMGSSILTRLIEVYAPAPSTENITTTITTTTATESEKQYNKNTTGSSGSGSGSSSSSNNNCNKPALPFDLSNERECIELYLSKIEKKQTQIRTAWLDLLRSIRETRELSSLADGVLLVTNWILNTAEQLLSQQQAMGNDMRTCEALRMDHNQLELECREIYAFYAELLYKIDAFASIRGDDCEIYRDLSSQRDFMQFVCRAFATRLERRRNMLITATRFFRLVNEYFVRTTLVFETLVMVKNEHEEFQQAAENLQKLKESQESLAHVERELLKEGEKLSDMLSMPVKDALGRDLNLDYSDDIRNVKHILDQTIIRRNIFNDSMELQKLTLEQLIHINSYEMDAQIAVKWMDDLYNVMIKCHAHVGCNIYEIQVQKDELQTFQETGKSIYNYGSQLLDASQALRKSCNLKVDTAENILKKLQRTWHCLLAISQEHMTRLRVSSVFHRSVEDYCLQLQNLRRSVRNLSKSTADKNAFHNSTSYDSLQNDMNVNEVPTVDIEKCDQLRKYLYEREQLLLEVGRMVRLGRLLKLRLKEPFVLDAITGKSVDVEDFTSDTTRSINSNDSVDMGQATLETSTVVEDSAIITVIPNGNNNMACEAVSQKLNEIAEIAEQLDEAIRYAQLIINENMSPTSSDILESNSNSSSSDKGKMEHLNSNSSEDWQSRSTEDDSFATASDGNFTQHSHSSSFQTASGRTSSHISSDKNSYDASDPDESTISFDLPNTGSQHSLNLTHSTLLGRSFTDRQHTNDTYLHELHSSSVTPTPNAQQQQQLAEIGVSAESDMDVSLYVNTTAIQTSNSHDKPNAAWRHSKYYENINNNKQAIKGFL